MENKCNEAIFAEGKANEKIKGFLRQLNEVYQDYERFYILAKIYLHMYMCEKNKVEYCKYKKDSVSFEQRDRYLNSMILILKEKYEKRFGSEV